MNNIINNNIFRINDEKHIFEIIDNNPNKLIVIFFVSSQLLRETFGDLKLLLIRYGNEFKNSIFLYVDISNYKTQHNIEIKKIPCVCYLYNGELCVTITDLDYSEIYKYFMTCYNKFCINNNLNNEVTNNLNNEITNNLNNEITNNLNNEVTNNLNNEVTNNLNNKTNNNIDNIKVNNKPIITNKQ
jgi:hypothetical protein